MEFDRRQFLALSSVGVIGAAAGCVGSQGSGESAPSSTRTATTTRTEANTATATETATETEQPTERPTATPPPAPEPVLETPFTEGLMEVKFPMWKSYESVRYLDDTSDSLKRLEPENEVFVMQDVFFDNLGNGTIPVPSYDRIELVRDGRTITPIKRLPGGVRYDQLRPEGPFISAYFTYNFDPPPMRSDMIFAGGVLFDTDAIEGSEHYVKYRNEKQIEGHSGPVFAVSEHLP